MHNAAGLADSSDVTKEAGACCGFQLADRGVSTATQIHFKRLALGQLTARSIAARAVALLAR